MDTVKLQEQLLELFQPNDDIISESGKRDGAAYLLLTNVQNPGRWAVVNTPGGGWTSIEVDGGFSHNFIDDSISDDQLIKLLADYIAMATAYVLGGGVMTKSRILKSPTITIEANGQRFALKPTVAAELRRLFRFGKTSNR